MKYLLSIILIILALVALAACQTVSPAEPTSPAVVVQVTATNTAEPIPTAVETNLPAPSATAAPTTQPTETPLPPINTPLPTPTAVPPLTLDPTEADVLAQLAALSEDHFYFLLRNTSADQQRPSADDVAYYWQLNPGEGSDILALQYDDINQDGQPDLLAVGETLLAIFFRSGESYTQPLVYIRYYYGPATSTRYQLADVTDNDQTELIIDYTETSIAATSRLTSWHRHIFQCQAFACHQILYFPPITIGEQSALGGIGIEKNTAILTAGADNSPQMTITNEYFNFDGIEFPEYFGDRPRGDFFSQPRIFDTSQTLFMWEDEAFTPLVTIELASSKPITTAEVLTAPLNTDTASIAWEKNTIGDKQNDICQLIFNEQPVAPLFGCKHQYTTLEWYNVIEDQTPELVLITLSPPSPLDEQGQPFSEDIACFHQRMMIYRLENGVLTEIANTAGCVHQSDLFGTRLEDYDQDGTIDIITAGENLLKSAGCLNPESKTKRNCWLELNTDLFLYRWDGATFTFSEQISDNE